MKTIDCKTIIELRNEVRTAAHYFNNKYENNFHIQKSFNLKSVEFYRKARTIYYDMFTLLDHLSLYNKIINTEKCMSCKFNTDHVIRLKNTFQTYKNLIAKCRDGANILQNNQ